MAIKRWTPIHTGIIGLFLLNLSVPSVRTDDQFICCMKGIKSIRNLAICPGVCCYGYEEKTVYASRLAKITYCIKRPDDETILSVPLSLPETAQRRTWIS